MEPQDTLMLLVDFKNYSSTSSEYSTIWAVIISGFFSIILAFITSKLTRKKELDKIKEHNENLELQVKQAILTIESENYKKLYELKLKALKEIKQISFYQLERNPENLTGFEEFLYRFPFYHIKELIGNFIVEYSYIFKEGITTLLKKIYHDCEWVVNNAEQADDFSDRAKVVYDNFKRLIILMEIDMDVRYKNFQEAIE